MVDHGGLVSHAKAKKTRGKSLSFLTPDIFQVYCVVSETQSGWSFCSNLANTPAVSNIV